MREIGRIIRRFAPTNNSPVSQALTVPMDVRKKLSIATIGLGCIGLLILVSVFASSMMPESHETIRATPKIWVRDLAIGESKSLNFGRVPAYVERTAKNDYLVFNLLPMDIYDVPFGCRAYAVDDAVIPPQSS